MRALLGTIVCKFGGDPTISVVEEAICAKRLQTDRQTDGWTDDGRRAIALAHWNELKIASIIYLDVITWLFSYRPYQAQVLITAQGIVEGNC